MHFTPPSNAAYWEPSVPTQCLAGDERRAKSAAARLRRQVCWWVGDSPTLSNHLHWLAHNGFNREDSRQIRYTVEVFHSCEPIFAIAHALAGCAVSRSQSFPGDFHIGSDLLPEAVKAGIAPMAGNLPTQPTDQHPFFRAMSAWPLYADLVSMEMLQWHAFPELVLTTVREARSLASRIVVQGSEGSDNWSGPHSDRLIASCETIVVTCALRRIFINAEIAARATAQMESCGNGAISTTV